FDELTLVLMCDALIVIGGGAGTLQEIAIAYRNNKPIIALDYLGGWGEKLAGKYLDERKRIFIKSAKTPAEAVSLVLKNKK
ncbi:MAG: SLOG cluster 4 domain-containing protein, partial [Patescibacteria group bacterium]